MKRCLALAGAIVLLGFVYLNNASWLARSPHARPQLLAHRGVHQIFTRAGLRSDTCTARRVLSSSHCYLENTVASMHAAFSLGASVVELDVQPTSDGDVVVFHDWRLECRTNGSGITRERSRAYLQALDIGYGYTYDGGKTFPFRGHGKGLMPTLGEVLDAFPDRRLLINIKGSDPAEADLLASKLLARSPAQRRRLMVYSGERPVPRLLELVPELRGLTRASVKACLVRYAAVGWTGHVPQACRNTLLLLPRNYAPYLWGWPHRFVARMKHVNTDVFLVAANDGTAWLSGIDTVDEFKAVVGNGYGGGLWTDRIEVVGPLLLRAGVEHR